MNLRTLTGLAAAAALFALPAAAAARTARFTATLSAVQTTSWKTVTISNGDCNGTPVTKGEGTEVFRFDSGRPEKILASQAGSSATSFTYGTWDPFAQESPLGLLGRERVTRHGQVVTHWSGGWCGQPPDSNSGPYDCGRRSAAAAGSFDLLGRGTLQASVTEVLAFKGFENCPLTTSPEVSQGAFTVTFGRLSNRLVFGRRKRIVVEDGKIHRLRTPGARALSTTHFRLVLVRKGGS